MATPLKSYDQKTSSGMMARLVLYAMIWMGLTIPAWAQNMVPNPGVYVYRFDLVYFNGVKEVSEILTGDVTLIR